VEGEGEGGEGEGETLTTEELMQMLLERFNDADTSGDGLLSYEEALAILTGITHEQFDALDADSDGYLSITELGGEEDDRCGCCKRTADTKINLKRYLGDWLLVGLSLMVLISLGSKRRIS